MAGTYPSSYPYQNASALYDITSGSNSLRGCTPSYLCTAGPGYDGPTGQGTPDGVAAFSSGPHGDIAGQVTDASTGQPVAGAEVSAPGGASAVTGTDGDYDLTLLAGSYNVTVADYGYYSQATDGVAVTSNATTTENFSVTREPTATVSGTVTDGSGQGWPLYASISINGVPGAPVYTNPYTGAYSVTLPRSASYTMTVTPTQPGYQATTQQVSLGTGNLTQNITVPVSTSTCVAPGYGVTETGGISEQFTGWTGTTPQDGWTVVDNEGNQTWEFGQDSPHPQAQPIGGDGGYAFVNSYAYGSKHSQDTSLVSPVVNLSGVSAPAIGFNTYYREYSGQTADVDLSLDGGQTWTTVWSQTTTSVDGFVVIPIPQAAGQSDVQVRFHFTGTYGDWWSLDNVLIGGDVGCNPLPGGLLAGAVKDGNTGQGVNGATVSSAGNPSDFGVTATIPDDPNLPDGFYELFSPLTGKNTFTAADSRYRSQDRAVTVSAGGVTEADFTLQAGHLTVEPSLSATEKMGSSATRPLTLTNTGRVAAQVTVGEQSGSFTSAASREGAPLRLVKGHYNPLQTLKKHAQGPALVQGPPAPAASTATAWTQLPAYPDAYGQDAYGDEPAQNVAAYDPDNGKLYTVGGVGDNLNGDVTGEMYDPATKVWAPIAPMPYGVYSATGQFIDGKLYVFGGYSGCCLIGIKIPPALQIYNPATNTWSTGSPPPGYTLSYSPASAVLDGQLYVVSGYGSYREAFRYDPGTNIWTQIASYPLPVYGLACGGVAGELVCAGGLDGAHKTYNSTYIYNPATNTWTQGASLPADLWGMGYAAANGQLLVSGGVTDDSTEVTNQGWAYQPSSNTWTALPNSLEPHYFGGSACGFFLAGGYQNQAYNLSDFEELPGYGGCGTDGTQVPWLAESPQQVTVPAGGSVTVAVTLNGAAAGVTQPGAYTADLELSTNTPYGTSQVGVTMNITPPRTWGKVTGTISGAACSGTTAPLAGATVQIDSAAGDDTLTTDQNGQYTLWLDKDASPLTLIVTDDGWRSQSQKVRIKAGQTTTADFTLTPQAVCS